MPKTFEELAIELHIDKQQAYHDMKQQEGYTNLPFLYTPWENLSDEAKALNIKRAEVTAKRYPHMLIDSDQG